MTKNKKKKNGIPKRVAGIKVPKKLRKQGNRALKLAENPLVREAAAAALLAGAQRLLATVEEAVETRARRTAPSSSDEENKGRDRSTE